MKLRNKFLPAMLVFGVVALSSCEKQEGEAAAPSFEQGTLSHVMLDSAEVTSYKVAGEQLNQTNHYNKETGELESFEKFERDSKGRVIKSSTHEGTKHTVLSEQQFEYNTNGELNKTTTVYFIGGKPAYSSFATFEYNSNKKLKKKSVFEGEANASKLKSYTTYEVMPNGNYSQEKQYIIDDKGQAKLYATTTYSYDTNYNPFHEFAEPGSTSSTNNMISATTQVHSSKKTYTYSYSYKYDERGYPVSQMVSNPNGKRETFTYLYSN